MQVNAANLEALYKGYRTQFLSAYHGQTSELVSQLLTVIPTSKAEEVIGWLGSVPGMKELKGEAVVQNLAAHTYSIPVKDWEDTVSVPRKEIERDSYGTYGRFMEAMGQAAGLLAEEQLAQLFMNGFTTGLGYTGGAFFSANQEPQKGGTKFSNKGTKKLSAANYQTARANIKGRLNAKGKPMGLGKDLVLIVSPTYEATARTILIADTVNNGTNVDKGTARLVVWPQLAAAEHNWFLVEAGYPIKPFIRLDEKPLEFNTNSTNLSDTQVMLTQQFIYQAFARQGFGYGLPELAYGSTGADAA